MTRILAPPAVSVPDVIECEAVEIVSHQEGEALRSWLERLMKHRKYFGITRVGSLTRLDRIGIPVVQVTRPMALSNTVSQGKGLNELSAAASGLMEAVETWAAERIPAATVTNSTASSFGADLIDLYDPWVSGLAGMDWSSLEVPWVQGWDLLSMTLKPVPLALVDTVYTYPSAHLPLFPRVTIGLGAGANMMAAIIQAGLEILERDALVQSHRTPYFFEHFQLDLSTIGSGCAALILNRIQNAGLLVGAWRAPSAHGLPVYRCHVMEAEWSLELAPMPAEGSACHFSNDHAFLNALIEACQSRLAAISGAREDITRQMYPSSHDRKHLAEWRDQLRSPGPLRYAEDEAGSPDSATTLHELVGALVQAGARAAIVVPLFSDDDLGVHVVRVVVPPLRLGPGKRHG
jgi:ribosomal protein S12 methylthiotransferase accessory factor